MSYHIQLPRFEGPLDLLLYLIRKEEMNIMEIEIHKITAQYLEFIQLMKELDLEVAGEFVAMAATLLQIKSKLLLPTYDENGEVIENEDPRKELVQRLLEYEKYKEAAKALLDRPWLGRDIWTRGIREKFGEVEEEIVLEDNALFSLIAMYRGVLRFAKKKVHQVSAKTQSISSRIMELKKYLIVGQRVSFFSIIDGAEDMLRQKLITFLSLLELGKLGFANLYQTDVYQDIWVETTRPIENDVLSSVEEYDKIHSDQAADDLFAKAEVARHEATDKVAHNDDEAEEFIMKDSFREEHEEEESLFATEEVASDEEILQAEKELKEEAMEAKHPGSTHAATEAPEMADEEPLQIFDATAEAVEDPDMPITAEEVVALDIALPEEEVLEFEDSVSLEEVMEVEDSTSMEQVVEVHAIELSTELSDVEVDPEEPQDLEVEVLTSADMDDATSANSSDEVTLEVLPELELAPPVVIEAAAELEIEKPKPTAALARPTVQDLAKQAAMLWMDEPAPVKKSEDKEQNNDNIEAQIDDESSGDVNV